MEYKEEEIVIKVAKKLKRFSPFQRIRKTKQKKLAIKLPYKKGEKLLNQRSAFFKEEYAKEEALLSWS